MPEWAWGAIGTAAIIAALYVLWSTKMIKKLRGRLTMAKFAIREKDIENEISDLSDPELRDRLNKRLGK